MTDEIMTAYTTNTTIIIEDEKDLEKIFNSNPMSEEVIQYFKDNQEKTKHIEVGNVFGGYNHGRVPKG